MYVSMIYIITYFVLRIILTYFVYITKDAKKYGVHHK